MWFAPDRILRTIWRSQRRGKGQVERGGDRSSMVGEGEEGLVVVRDDHRPITERVLTVGGAYKALELDAKCAIEMGTRLAMKIHKRGERDVKPGRHVFFTKVGTEERIMDFLRR